MSDKQIELKVMTSVDSFTIAETFNGTMAIHSPCGQGIIILTKEQAADFFGDSNQELIADLQHKVAWFEKFSCKTCGGAGSVGTPPDDYYDCPDCVQPFNKMERDFKLLRDALEVSLTSMLDSGYSVNSVSVRKCMAALAATAKGCEGEE